MKQLTEKRYAKFFLHASGNIAAKFSYDQVAIGLLALFCWRVPFWIFETRWTLFSTRYLLKLAVKSQKLVGVQKRGILVLFFVMLPPPSVLIFLTNRCRQATELLLHPPPPPQLKDNNTTKLVSVSKWILISNKPR